MSSRGYGVLINSARKLEIYCGTTQLADRPEAQEERDRTTSANWEPHPYSDCMEILVPSDGVDVYFFAGRDAGEVVQRYNLFCGANAGVSS